MLHLRFFYLGSKASMHICIFQIALVFLFIFSSCKTIINKTTFIKENNYNKYYCYDTLYYDVNKFKSSNGYSNYCPDTTISGYTPWRIINVNVHFIAKNDSSGNFDQTIGTEYAYQMINVANEFLRNNKPSQLPAGISIPIRPINLAYKLKGISNTDNGIYFHYNDSIYNLFKANDNSLYNTYVFNKYGIQKGSVINIFMVEQNNLDTLPILKNPAGAVGISFGSFIKLHHSYFNYKRPKKDEMGNPVIQDGWSSAKSINHEIGHSLGLMHSWNNDDCNDTPNNNNCYGYDSLKDCKVFSNNVMDYNYLQNSFSPCQIGKIHYLCTQYNSPQRKWLDSIWCTPISNQILWLNTKDTIIWSVDKELTNSIVLLNKTVLIVKGKLSIPKDCEIVVHPYSSLIIDRGQILNTCNLKWNGIRILKKARKRGSVKIYNNGKILNTK
jgi:hypothetical protein